MALNTFGVTAGVVAADMFPQWGAFDANSSPTTTTVGRFIDEEAADLAGRLYAENIVASAIEDDESVAYVWCAKTLKLMVAVRIFAVATQNDPELRKSYQAELTARLKLLAEQGGTALGDEGLNTGTSDPDGPTWHGTTFGLTTDSAANMSSTVPLLRKGDVL